MVVVGGYNSQQHLPPRGAGALPWRARVPHRGRRRIDPDTGTIRHQPIGSKREEIATAWLDGARIIGITAGASTPNNKIGETIARICRTAGQDLGAVVG